MNIRSVGGTLLSIIETLGPVAGPQGKAIAAVAAIVHDALTPVQREAEARVPFVDKDKDGIDDSKDTDGGTVASVTDEIINAGVAAYDDYMHKSNTGMSFEGQHRAALIAAYLAMCNARPSV